jgi:hypothetical protein
MADRKMLLAAVEMGRCARAVRLRTGSAQRNTYRLGTLEHECFEAGYENDLDRWLEFFNGRPVTDGRGRFRAHEVVALTRPGSNPEKADFVRYAGDGLAVVESHRFSRRELVPLNWLAHRKRGVAA